MTSGGLEMSNEMEQLRVQMDDVNLEILELINRRAEIVQQIGQLKTKQSIKRFDPVREREMLDKIKDNNNGPFQNSTLEHIFKEIFKARSGRLTFANSSIRKWTGTGSEPP